MEQRGRGICVARGSHVSQGELPRDPTTASERTNKKHETEMRAMLEQSREEEREENVDTGGQMGAAAQHSGPEGKHDVAQNRARGPATSAVMPISTTRCN